MNEVAYSPEPLDNPNFVSRPPDSGLLGLARSVGYDALYHSPFRGVMRFSEMMLEKSPQFNVDGDTLQPEDAQKKYGLNGQLKFDEPIKESAAQLMMRRKIDENGREYDISRGMTSGFRQAAGLGVGMAATMVDPINTASMFIPVVGEARFARMVSRYGGSYLKARLAAGAIEGTVGMAMVEPFVLLPAMQEQSNYGLEQSAMNLMYGAGLGAFLHAGLGAVGDRLKRMKPREKDAIFEAAMNNVLKGEPVTAPSKAADFVETPTTPRDIIDHVASLNSDDFYTWAREQPEGTRGVSEQMGTAARTDPIVGEKLAAELKAAEADFAKSMTEYRAAQGEAKTTLEDVISAKAAKVQFFSEAIGFAAEGEKIIAAAIKMDDGTIHQGKNHPTIAEELMAKNATAEDHFEADGFITSSGRFLDREEAMKLAQQSGQFKELLPEQFPEELDSANLLSQHLEIPPERNINEIPRRDAKGKFLSNAQRLDMLHKKIQDERIRIENQGQIKDIDTQTDISRFNMEVPKSPSETPKEAIDITKEADELEQSLFGQQVDKEALAEFNEQLKAEIGDPKARQAGIEAAVKCITENLI